MLPVHEVQNSGIAEMTCYSVVVGSPTLCSEYYQDRRPTIPNEGFRGFAQFVKTNSRIICREIMLLFLNFKHGYFH
jgi:hypothetical protein